LAVRAHRLVSRNGSALRRSWTEAPGWQWLLTVAFGLALVLLAMAMAEVLYERPTTLAMALGGGLGLAGVFALAVVRYDAAVALGFLLLGAVWVEPAPTDGVFAILIAVAAATGRLGLSHVPRSVLILLGALLALNLASAMAAVDLGAATRFLVITLYLITLGVWLTEYVNSPARGRLVAAAYIAAAVGSALLGSLSVVAAFPGSDLMSAGGLRARGLFEDPNVFGPFLVPATLLLIAERARPRLFAPRPALTTAMIVVLVLGVVLSYSRAAWINLAVGVCVLAFILAKGRGGVRRALAVAVAVAIAGTATIAVIETTGSGTFFEERARVQSYDTERFDAQQAGIDLGLAHPLGIGPGQFEILVPVAAHSLYVRVLSEQGLPGMAVLLALLGTTLVLAARNLSLQRNAYGVSSAALLAAWCGILVNSLVVDTLHWRHLWVVAALIWAGAMQPMAYQARTSSASP
jgi:O-antigen ligase